MKNPLVSCCEMWPLQMSTLSWLLQGDIRIKSQNSFQIPSICNLSCLDFFVVQSDICCERVQWFANCFWILQRQYIIFESLIVSWEGYSMKLLCVESFSTLHESLLLHLDEALNTSREVTLMYWYTLEFHTCPNWLWQFECSCPPLIALDFP